MVIYIYVYIYIYIYIHIYIYRISLQDLPNPGIEPGSPALQTDSLLSEPPGKPNIYTYIYIYTHNNLETVT